MQFDNTFFQLISPNEETGVDVGMMFARDGSNFIDTAHTTLIKI